MTCKEYYVLRILRKKYYISLMMLKHVGQIRTVVLRYFARIVQSPGLTILPLRYVIAQSCI
jgi:hypothetical protein